MPQEYHVPVLVQEVLTQLELKPGMTVVDATLGGGGHAGEILTRISPAGHLIGFDRDAEAIQQAQARFGREALGVKIDYVHDRFDHLREYLEEFHISRVDAILADLGVSSHQLDTAERGFSFQAEGPLDMRMDPTTGETAQQLIHSMSEQDLARTIRDLGEESLSRPIARALKQREAAGTLHTTRDLAEAVAAVVRPRYRTPSRVHPATKTFQALRIAVNQELEALRAFLPQAMDMLVPSGRLAVITFHSLEDRIVKQFFQHEARGCICPPEIPVCRCGHTPRLRVLTKKPVRASATEIVHNPRGRSAQLRAAQRL